MTATTSTPPVRATGPRPTGMDGTSKVRTLAGFTALLAVLIASHQTAATTVGGRFDLPWWALVPMVYAAELMVVHLRFRREAHTFSLSEIPLIIGLFFSTPSDLLLAVVLGNLLVLTIHRRQPALKLMFNVAQFALVTTVGIAVFRSVVQIGDPFGPAGWIGALAAALSGVVIAALLIGRAIAMMGGTLGRAETITVVSMGAAGALANAALALILVNLLQWNPGAAWLGLAPLGVVYLAYNAYVSQMAERARLKAIYEATLDLHNTPRIEDALLCAVRHARSMVDAEAGHVVIFSDDAPSMAYRTSMVLDLEPITMRETKVDRASSPWADVIATRTSVRFARQPAELMPSIGPMNDGIIVPLIDRTDRCVGLLVVANRLGDISAFDDADVELLETLASRVTVTLENGRLEDTLRELTVLKNRLEEAAASKDQFIASISHELRTPLTAVVGLSNELTTHGHLLEEAESHEFIQLIAEQSLELSYIVDDLLVAARADSGTLHLEPELVDLAAVVESEVLAQFARTDLPAPSISIPRRGNVLSWADPSRVRQIVRNLLQNAQRYGGDDIAVAIERRGDTATVIVSDDGPGVPPGSEETIFRAFERAHGTAAQPASVGLGLAVARQLARVMGGDLTYDRHPARTDFVLTLPPPGPGTMTTTHTPAAITIL